MPLKNIAGETCDGNGDGNGGGDGGGDGLFKYFKFENEREFVKGFLGRETLFMMINDDQKFTMISMFTIISMSKIHNHRYKNSFCEIEPQINQII